MKSLLKDKHGQPLTLAEASPKIMHRFVTYWLEFKTACLWWLSYLPSHSLRRFLLHLSGMDLGKSTYIHSGVRVYNPVNITIGKGSIIGYNAHLDGRDSLRIGNHVDIASEVMIYNGQHDIHSAGFDPVFKPVTIKDFSFIGPRAIIMPGVTIGTGAVVAAGAIVTKSVADFTIVAGIPAKPIGLRQIQNPHYRLGRPRLFL